MGCERIPTLHLDSNSLISVQNQQGPLAVCCVSLHNEKLYIKKSSTAHVRSSKAVFHILAHDNPFASHVHLSQQIAHANERQENSNPSNSGQA